MLPLNLFLFSLDIEINDLLVDWPTVDVSRWKVVAGKVVVQVPGQSTIKEVYKSLLLGAIVLIGMKYEL